MILLLDGGPSFLLEQLTPGNRPHEFIWNESIYKLERKLLPPLYPQVQILPPWHDITKFIYVNYDQQTFQYKRFFVQRNNRGYEFIIFSSSEENEILEEIKGQIVYFNSWSLNNLICEIVRQHINQVRGFYVSNLFTMKPIEDVKLFINLRSNFNYFYDCSNNFDFIINYCPNSREFPNANDALIHDFTANALDKSLRLLLIGEEEDYLEILRESIGDLIDQPHSIIHLRSEENLLKELKEYKKYGYLTIYIETQDWAYIYEALNKLSKYSNKQFQIFITKEKKLPHSIRLMFNKVLRVSTFDSIVQAKGITKVFYACLYQYYFHMKKEKLLFHGSRKIIDNNELAPLLEGINSFDKLFMVLESVLGNDLIPSFMLLSEIDFWYEFTYVKGTLLKDETAEKNKVVDQVSGISKIIAEEKLEAIEAQQIEQLIEPEKVGIERIEENKVPDQAPEISEVVPGDKSEAIEPQQIKPDKSHSEKIEERSTASNIIQTEDDEEWVEHIGLNFHFDAEGDEDNWSITSKLFDESVKVDYDLSKGIKIMAYLNEFTGPKRKISALS